MMLRHFPHCGRALPRRQKSFLPSRASNRGEKGGWQQKDWQPITTPKFMLQIQRSASWSHFPSWKLSPDSATPSPLDCLPQWPSEDWREAPADGTAGHPWHITHRGSGEGRVASVVAKECSNRAGIFPYKLNLFNVHRPQSSEIAGLWKLVFLMSQMLIIYYIRTQGYSITCQHW